MRWVGQPPKAGFAIQSVPGGQQHAPLSGGGGPMKKPVRNVGASVRDRLLKLTRATGKPNGELLDRYCIERLLYRL